MRQIKALGKYAEVGPWRREVLICVVVGSLGIIIIDLLTLRYGAYYSDNILILYPVAMHSLTESFKVDIRPFEYLIILVANNIYLPLWLGVTLLCTIGATILAALVCERMFERQLPEPGWWVLGVANPLLFYVISQPIVSQALCNLFFAGAMLAFVSELDRLSDQAARGWRADKVAVLLNLIAAALFFTKETAVVAATLIPAVATLIRIKRRQSSPLFVFSLLFPIAAGICWILLKIWEKLTFPYSMVPTVGEGRYDLKLNPILWAENFITTLSFPITPLPSSFIGFELLRPLWISVALGSVILFTVALLRESVRRPKVVLPLFVIAASCAPMILIRPSELYSSMIAPFAVSIVLSNLRWLSLAYGLILYAASLGNGIIFWLGPNFNLLGLGHLEYSIYGKEYQVDPICPIGTTAHVAREGTPANDLPGVKNRLTCVR
jgi:hypothetical protein